MMINGKAEKCCGCKACGSACPKNAITFHYNSKGFTEPIIDHAKCVNCGLCNTVCPLECIQEPKSDFKQVYFVAKLKDYQERRKSQSGGVFAALAKSFIAQKGVVYGAVIDKNLDVVYERATTYKEIQKMRGSKYVQADIKDSIVLVKKDLEQGKKVLFSGTPCYVHGLISFLSGTKTDMSNLLTVDLVCHGTPSHRLYKQYINSLENRYHKKIKRFVFRDNEYYDSVFTLQNSVQYLTKDYSRFFYSRFALRDSCYTCHYANTNRVGDITIGDCWGYEKFNPNFDPGIGCSLVIVNTEHGLYSFQSILSDFEFEATTLNHILQPNLEHPTDKPDLIEEFWNDYKKFGSEYVLRVYCKCDLSDERSVLYEQQRIKRFIRKVYSKANNGFEH